VDIHEFAADGIALYQPSFLAWRAQALNISISGNQHAEISNVSLSALGSIWDG
jgi:hypothetical protein